MEENDKIKERIRKLLEKSQLGQSQLGKDLGSMEDLSDEAREQLANEAMSAAKMAENLLLKYKLSRADIVTSVDQEAEEIIPVFGFTIVPDFIKRANARVASKRKIWFEELAKVVAEGYFCKSAPRPQTKEVVFYGLDMDREIAMYVFQRLAESASELAKSEWKKVERAAGTVNFETLEEIPYIDEDVFMHNFHRGFRATIRETYTNRMGEENERAWKIFEKAKEETRVYFESVRERHLERDLLELKVLEENAFAMDVGLKAGNRVSTRIDSIAGDRTEIEKANSALNAENAVVWILLDASGSMWGDKFTQAKFGARDYATQASEKGYNVGVISFDHNVKVVVAPQKNINVSWHSAVNKISAGGSTNLTDAIKQAKSRFPSSRVKRIICIITDGQPNNSETALAIAADCKKTGIELVAIGTDDADETFLNQLTDMHGIKVERSQLRSAVSDAAKLLLPA